MDIQFLRKLGRNPHKFQSLIRHADKKQIQSLVDATVRIMRKEVPLKSRMRNAVIKQRLMLRHIAHPKYSTASKKRYLIQKGGGPGKIVTSLLTGIAKLGTKSLPSLTRLGGKVAAKLTGSGYQSLRGARSLPALSRAPSTILTTQSTPRSLVHSSAGSSIFKSPNMSYMEKVGRWNTAGGPGGTFGDSTMKLSSHGTPYASSMSAHGGSTISSIQPRSIGSVGRQSMTGMINRLRGNPFKPSSVASGRSNILYHTPKGSQASSTSNVLFETPRGSGMDLSRAGVAQGLENPAFAGYRPAVMDLSSGSVARGLQNPAVNYRPTLGSRLRVWAQSTPRIDAGYRPTLGSRARTYFNRNKIKSSEGIEMTERQPAWHNFSDKFGMPRPLRARGGRLEIDEAVELNAQSPSVFSQRRGPVEQFNVEVPARPGRYDFVRQHLKKYGTGYLGAGAVAGVTGGLSYYGMRSKNLNAPENLNRIDNTQFESRAINTPKKVSFEDEYSAPNPITQEEFTPPRSKVDRNEFAQPTRVEPPLQPTRVPPRNEFEIPEFTPRFVSKPSRHRLTGSKTGYNFAYRNPGRSATRGSEIFTVGRAANQ